MGRSRIIARSLFWWALACLPVGACSLAPPAGLDSAPASTEWFGVFIDDDRRVGTVRIDQFGAGEGERRVRTSEILVSEADSAPVRLIDRTEHTLDAEGRPVVIVNTSGSGRDEVLTRVEIDSDTATVLRQTRYGEGSVRVSLPPETRFDDGQALIPAWSKAPQNPLEFNHFDIAAPGVERVILTAHPAAASDGSLRVSRTAYVDDAVQGHSEMIVAEGRLLSSTAGVFGMSMTLRRLSPAEAALSPSPASIVRSVMLKSPNRISSRAAGGHIRYAFAFKAGRAFDFPETPEQRVRRDGDVVTLDICAVCGPQLRTDADFLANALRPTLWMQVDSPRLRAAAAIESESNLTGRQKMDILGVRARRALNTRDFSGHYSALESLSRRAGDCTEDAVLLAAMARAAGIPAFVVSGLVYSRERYHGMANVFMPHSWTIAFVDGEWRSFDISLDGFDATHVALSINEGDAAALSSAQQRASFLEWREMVEVLQRPEAQ